MWSLAPKQRFPKQISITGKILIIIFTQKPTQTRLNCFFRLIISHVQRSFTFQVDFGTNRVDCLEAAEFAKTLGAFSFSFFFPLLRHCFPHFEHAQLFFSSSVLNLVAFQSYIKGVWQCQDSKGKRFRRKTGRLEARLRQYCTFYLILFIFIC